MRYQGAAATLAVTGLSALLGCGSGGSTSSAGAAAASGASAGSLTIAGNAGVIGGNGAGGGAASVAGAAPHTGGSAGAPAASGGASASSAATGLTPSPLGSGDHTPGSVSIGTVATVAGCLNEPWDLAFNPKRPTELWIPSHGDDGMCIVTAATSGSPKSERRLEPSHSHFMARPAGLAFGGDATSFGIPGTFSTANDSEGDGNPLDGQLWNGIVLWSSDLQTFGVYHGADGNSHLDMLHDSPGARGIAWEKDNIYWVFGAYLGDITRYDFVQDHGRGNADHSDGKQWHYVAGKVKAVPGAPSQLAYDATSGALYIADTGNGRVAKLDTKSGTQSPTRHTRPRDRIETQVDAVLLDANLADVVPAGGELKAPAGLELSDNVLYVSDWSTGVIHSFSADGKHLNWLDTGLGAGTVGGVAIGPDGRLYFVAAKTNAVHVITP